MVANIVLIHIDTTWFGSQQVVVAKSLLSALQYDPKGGEVDHRDGELPLLQCPAPKG